MTRQELDQEALAILTAALLRALEADGRLSLQSVNGIRERHRADARRAAPGSPDAVRSRRVVEMCDLLLSGERLPGYGPIVARY